MNTPSFAARVRYWFDNTMARGTSAVIGLLAAASLAWILVLGLIAWLAGFHPDGGGKYSYIEATWRQLTFTLDPGTFSGDTGWPWLILSLLTTLFGVIVIASLIGVVGAAFDDKITELRKGKSNVLESGHTVIVGWNSKVFTIIAELVTANESERKPVIVVLADRDKLEMEEAIREKAGDTKNTKVICRSGNPLDQDELLRANPYAAKSIIVLGDEDSADPDSMTIKTTLALTNHPRRPAGDITIVGEVRDLSNLEAARLVGKDEARWVLPLEMISKLTVQTCRQSGLSTVYSELLRFEGDEIYFTEQGELAGLTYLECQMRFASSTVIGVANADGPVVNPASDRVLAHGEQLIVIAEDDSTIAVTPAGVPDDSKVIGVGKAESVPERTLILGSNSQLPLMLAELNEYVASGSVVTVVSTHPVPELGPHPHLTIDVRDGDTSDRKTLVALLPGSYDHVLVLAYRDHLEAEAADAKTLVTLLLLREIADANDLDLNIVSEMLDDRNRKLAEVTKADDFIVSDNLMSLMMSQISENSQLSALYNGLFAAEGAEVYLRPAEWYVVLDTPVDFYTVAAGAAKRGETAIGYRDITPMGAGDGQAAIRVNPPKAEPRTYSAGDRIIVFAED